MSLLRNYVLAIGDEEVTFVKRRFSCQHFATRVHLEAIGKTFLRGYRAGLAERQPDALCGAIDAVVPELRGFAFEGGGMALTLLDSLFPWRHRLRALLMGPGRSYRYMLHVGAGWARARLRRRAAPWIENDPLLGWLAVDGFGFHQGYFHPETFVTAGRRPARIGSYAARAFDQGLGRSLWFIFGADPLAASRAIARMAPERHGDLWSGLGLAAAYAGNGSRPAHDALRRHAGAFLPTVAQGVAFAAAARVEADNLTENTRAACQLFCECEPATAAAIVVDARARLTRSTDETRPEYEGWRQAISAVFGANRDVAVRGVR